MGYCTAADVRDMLTDDAAHALTGNDDRMDDAGAREVRILELIDDAIRDAGGEVDGYVAKRYPVPLAPVPGIIAKLAKDIALYNLFARIGIDEDGRDKTYLTRYNAAIAFLRLVAEGKCDIGTAGITGGRIAPAKGMTLSSAPRLFSRRSLRGM